MFSPGRFCWPPIWAVCVPGAPLSSTSVALAAPRPATPSTRTLLYSRIKTVPGGNFVPKFITQSCTGPHGGLRGDAHCPAALALGLFAFLSLSPARFIATTPLVHAPASVYWRVGARLELRDFRITHLRVALPMRPSPWRILASGLFATISAKLLVVRASRNFGYRKLQEPYIRPASLLGDDAFPFSVFVLRNHLLR